MTAPDPGLTDLIAAHRLHTGLRTQCECGINVSHEDWPGHVALVVKQNTNGRTAHWQSVAEVSRSRELNALARAEKAEATIYRVKNALPNIEGINPASSHYDKGWDRGQQILTEHIQSAITGDYTRAALEGEQQ